MYDNTARMLGGFILFGSDLCGGGRGHGAFPTINIIVSGVLAVLLSPEHVSPTG